MRKLFSKSLFLLLILSALSSDAAAAEIQSLIIDSAENVSVFLFPDISDLNEDGGRSVAIFVDPPANYSAIVGGYWFGRDNQTELRITEGEWRHGEGRGPMTPYSKYNITIYDGDNHEVANGTFMTDVGTPATAVSVQIEEIKSTVAIINIKPLSKSLLYGPPTGYRVELCPKHSPLSCLRQNCTIVPCVIHHLKESIDYRGSVWAYNTGFWNENRENSSLHTTFELTTNTPRQLWRIWFILMTMQIVAIAGLGITMIICGLRRFQYEPIWDANTTIQ